MVELRDKIMRTIEAAYAEGGGVFFSMEAANRILAMPEIADALKLVPVKNLGPSVSTGKRDPV